MLIHKNLAKEITSKVGLHWFSYNELPIGLDVLSTQEELIAKERHILSQERFRKTRSMLRVLLGKYLDITPKTIPIDYGSKGKPIVINSPLHFNLSHSGDYVVYGFCWEAPIGIDVEYIRPRNFRGLAQRYFLPQEYTWISHLTAQSQGESFYRTWVCKEALVKMLGTSLHQGFTLLDTTPLLTGAVDRLIYDNATITEIAAPPHYRSALSVYF